MKERSINDQGKSFVEVLVAILILVVVICGVYLAVQYVSGEYGNTATEKEFSAEEHTQAVLEKIGSLIQNADVEVTYDYTVNKIYIVSVRGYAIATMKDNYLYIFEEAFDDPNGMSDDEKVKAAKATEEMGSIFDETLVTFFLDETNRKSGTTELCVRTKSSDKDSSYLTKILTLNEYVVKRANGEAFEREAVATPTATTTPAPTKQVAEPTKEVTEKDDTKADASKEEKTEEKRTVLLEGSGKLDIKTLRAAKEGAVLEINVICEEEKASKKWCVGGLCFGTEEVTDNTDFQYILGENLPSLGKLYKAEYLVSDIVAELEATGATTISVSFYNGFAVDSVVIVE